MHMLIRHATMEDLDAIEAVEAACFPPAEAATNESLTARAPHIRNISGFDQH